MKCSVVRFSKGKFGVAWFGVMRVDEGKLEAVGWDKFYLG